MRGQWQLLLPIVDLGNDCVLAWVLCLVEGDSYRVMGTTIRSSDWMGKEQFDLSGGGSGRVHGEIKGLSLFYHFRGNLKDG